MFTIGWKREDYEILEITHNLDISLHNLFDMYAKNKQEEKEQSTDDIGD